MRINKKRMKFVDEKKPGFLQNKKGMELSEIGKIIFAVFLLVLLIFAIILLLKGKGGEVLAAIKKLIRFGRA